MSTDDPVASPAPHRSPYAVPYDRFAGDAQIDRANLVVEHPHDQPLAAPTPVGTPGDDGD